MTTSHITDATLTHGLGNVIAGSVFPAKQEQNSGDRIYFGLADVRVAAVLICARTLRLRLPRKYLVALNFPPGDSAIFRRAWPDTRSQNSFRSLWNAGTYLSLRMRLPLKSGSATKIRTSQSIRF